MWPGVLLWCHFQLSCCHCLWTNSVSWQWWIEIYLLQESLLSLQCTRAGWKPAPVAVTEMKGSNLQSFCNPIVLYLCVFTIFFPGNIFNSLWNLWCIPIVYHKVLEKTFAEALFFLRVGVISLLPLTLPFSLLHFYLWQGWFVPLRTCGWECTEVQCSCHIYMLMF